MERLTYIGVMVFTICFITSCRSSTGTASGAPEPAAAARHQNEKDFFDLEGSGNFCIDSTAAAKMINTFDSVFGKKANMTINALTRKIWIEGATFNALNKAITDSTYDGVRFYFGASIFDDFPNETKKNKSLVIAVATLKAADSLYHPDAWSYKIPIATMQPAELRLNMPKVLVNIAVNQFKAIFREDTSVNAIDSLSTAVWIDKKVMARLAGVLNNPANNLDGYRLYMGAYSMNMPGRRDQKYPIQSTILLVPTNRDTKHSDNWKVLNICERRDAANHGELCPRNCPPTEP